MERFDRTAPSATATTPASDGATTLKADLRRTIASRAPRSRKRAATALETKTLAVALEALGDPTRVPLEVMLDNMSTAIRRAHALERMADGVESRELRLEIRAYREDAQAAAQAAAPYMHPKMAPIVPKGETGVAVTFTIEGLEP